MDSNDDQLDWPLDEEADKRRGLEELSEEDLVALFKSTEVRREQELALMRQVACAFASRDGASIARVSELLGVSRPTIYEWLKKRQAGSHTPPSSTS